jgi:hypothetical protein
MIASSSSNVTNSSSMINDLPTPNVPWTPFTPSEWPTKYESSWPLPPPPPTQNPFAQRQISKDESNLWPEIPTNTSWLKFSPTSPLNRQENETNIPVSSFISNINQLIDHYLVLESFGNTIEFINTMVAKDTFG